jgi:hypothetical protein
MNEERTFFEKIIDHDDDEIGTKDEYVGGSLITYCANGKRNIYSRCMGDLAHEFHEGWEPMVVGSLMEESKKPQYDRDEVLRVATALATGDYANSMGGATPYSELVSDAIELIDTVNEITKGAK